MVTVCSASEFKSGVLEDKSSLTLADDVCLYDVSTFHSFSGELVGNGYTLYVDSPIFMVNQGVVEDVHIECKISVDENKKKGSLCHSNVGLVKGCSVAGIIAGSITVGGLVGENKGTVGECRCSVDVRGQERVGGLVGDNIGGTVYSCTATDEVSVYSDRILGGVVGQNNGLISLSVSHAELLNTVMSGSLVGLHKCYHGYSKISKSYGTSGNHLIGSNLCTDDTIIDCYHPNWLLGENPHSGENSIENIPDKLKKECN